jgi:hypothetical protein
MRIDPDACRDPVLLAAEVRRLQAVIDSESTLTDAEREAVHWAAYAAEQWYEHTAAATLRGLLERMK